MQNNRIGGEDTMLKTIDFSTKKKHRQTRVSILKRSRV